VPIGPLAAAFGTSEMLLIAGFLNVAVCIGIVLVPSVCVSTAEVTASLSRT
jgi:hypothetical protein